MAPGGTRLSVLVQDDPGLGTVAELRLSRVVSVHAQPERALVPGDRPVDVGHVQMDGAEPKRCRQGRRLLQLGGEGVGVGHRSSVLLVSVCPYLTVSSYLEMIVDDSSNCKSV